MGHDRRRLAPWHQADLRAQHDQIDEQQQVINCQAHEAQGAPQQQFHPRAPVAAREQEKADQARQKAQQVDDGGDSHA
jgi:hypothetical protein